MILDPKVHAHRLDVLASVAMDLVGDSVGQAAALAADLAAALAYSAGVDRDGFVTAAGMLFDRATTEDVFLVSAGTITVNVPDEQEDAKGEPS